MAKALFGMGCFWGPQKLFDNLKGITKTTVGYAGGDKEKPIYHNLGDHTESILIEYDPKVINYRQLLENFFDNHDFARQASRQYRSVIFYYDDKQKNIAKEELEKRSRAMTSLEPYKNFYPAEQYHQKYLEKNGGVC